jgi:hypothetical protein
MIFLFSAGTAWAGGATLRSAEGPVWVKKGGQGKWTRVQVPYEFGTYDKVGTTAGTAVVALTDGSKIRVCPNSALQVFGVSLQAVSVYIPHGIVEFFISKNPQRKFTARTPVVVASVRGTVFRSDVQPKGPSTFSVFSGGVRLSTRKGRSVDLAGGQWAAVDEKGIISKPTLLALDVVVPVDPDQEKAAVKPAPAPAAEKAEAKQPEKEKVKEPEKKAAEEKEQAETPPPDEDYYEPPPPPPPDTVEEDIAVTVVSPSTPQ